ncbi:MAG: hypothetical protein V1686_01770 [Patescibacteria group bacterium]
MEPEKKFKEELIKDLNLLNSNWIDGDEESGSKKKADIVNHSLKIAIEIKDDTNYRIAFATEPGVMTGQGIDMEKMNQRFSDHIKSADNKFKEYSDYKTILILRTEFLLEKIIGYAIEGCHSYLLQDRKLIYAGRRKKYSKYCGREIGCFLIFINREKYYLSNNLAKDNRIVLKNDAESILGLALNDVPAI